jgi:hypothetical protein
MVNGERGSEYGTGPRWGPFVSRTNGYIFIFWMVVFAILAGVLIATGSFHPGLRH